LADYNQINSNDERIKEITNLGLTYNLLTEYTSFIAADTEIRNQDGQTTTVQQPLPLPHGVSNLAVAGMAGSGTLHKSLRGGPVPVAPRQETVDMAMEEERSKKKMSVEVKVEIQSENLEKYHSDFEQMIKKQENVLQYCYLKSGSTGIPGKIKFQVTLNKQHQIIEVKAIENTLNNKNLENCLAKEIKALKLISPDTTREISFIVEINFENFQTTK
jgi:Ca-activated chloride channel family protein